MKCSRATASSASSKADVESEKADLSVSGPKTAPPAFSSRAGRLTPHLRSLHNVVKDIFMEMEIKQDEDDEEITECLQTFAREDPREVDRAALNLHLLDTNIIRLQQALSKISASDNEPDVTTDVSKKSHITYKSGVFLQRSDTMNSTASTASSVEVPSGLVREQDHMSDLERFDGHWDHLGDFGGFVSGMGRGPNRTTPCPKWCYHCRTCTKCNPNARAHVEDWSDDVNSSDSI